MDYRSLHMKTVVDLRKIAKDEKIKVPAGTNKAVLVEMIVAHYQKKAAETEAAVADKTLETVSAAETAQANKTDAAVEPPMEPTVNATQLEPAQDAVPETQTGENETAEKRNESPVQPEQARPVRRESMHPAYSGHRVYQRPMSTQQRMGARTQPIQNNYRQPQQGRPQARFNTETNLSRPQRSYDSGARNYENNSRGYDNGARNPANNMRSYDNASDAYENNSRGYDNGHFSYRYSAGEDARENTRMPIANNGETTPRRMGYGDGQPNGDERPFERPFNANVQENFNAGECGEGAGILEIHPDGYGFLRAENYLPGNKDVYVSAAQIRRFNLRTGDYVVGKTRPQQMGDRSVGLIFINEINGQSIEKARNRRPFDSLVPVYPNERLRMEQQDAKDYSMRLIDVLAPIGKGQRGMIVSPPKAGKTTLLKKVANAITANHPEVHLIVLLIDERPEEVTDMKRSIQGEVVYSTFDEAPENHTRVSEMVLERAQRLVELGKDVVILLDSITRLARAYNLVIPPTGRSLSGGLDPGALYRPKRFFGAARNIENGGSLTIIATALVDTGSRMDDIIFEEFKGTGNMELHLDRSLSDRRIFPAIDMYKSGTRREELLLSKEELEGSYQVRRMLSKGSPQETAEQLILFMEKTKTNAEFFQKVKGWMTAFEKDGFKMR